MKPIALVLASVLSAPLLVHAAAGSPASKVPSDTETVVDLSGHWKLNTDLSDKPPQPGEAREPGEWSGRGRGGRPPGGGPGGGGFPGGGGYPGGGMRGGGMRGGHVGGRSPEEMANMRDAMRAALDAPPEMIVTRKDDEVVLTAVATGDVTRILVTGKKMKSTAGGAEHEVKASYKDAALVVESSFGPMKVLDSWRLSDDGRRLERATKIEGGRGDRQIRRVYDRAE